MGRPLRPRPLIAVPRGRALDPTRFQVRRFDDSQHGLCSRDRVSDAGQTTAYRMELGIASEVHELPCSLVEKMTGCEIATQFLVDHDTALAVAPRRERSRARRGGRDFGRRAPCPADRSIGARMTPATRASSKSSR